MKRFFEEVVSSRFGTNLVRRRGAYHYISQELTRYSRSMRTNQPNLFFRLPVTLTNQPYKRINNLPKINVSKGRHMKTEKSLFLEGLSLAHPLILLVSTLNKTEDTLTLDGNEILDAGLNLPLV